MFRPAGMKLPDTWGKLDLSKVPQEIRDSIQNNRPRRIYYANLAQMDDCLGRVLNALRELDLEKDTVILYTADHGEMLGEHGLWQKFVFYESSAGVPLIVRAPGITPGGARSKTPVSLARSLPTLLELPAHSARKVHDPPRRLQVQLLRQRYGRVVQFAPGAQGDAEPGPGAGVGGDSRRDETQLFQWHKPEEAR
jgi:arylsulfatase A-like enzyme